MKSYDQLARAAYAAFFKQANGETFDGKPLSTWQQIGAEQQANWVAAARAVVDEVKHLH